jgi:hypothetical protein
MFSVVFDISQPAHNFLSTDFDFHAGDVAGIEVPRYTVLIREGKSLRR